MAAVWWLLMLHWIALAPWKAVNSQLKKGTYLEVQPGMPKTKALGCCSCVYRLCLTLKVSKSQLSFVNSRLSNRSSQTVAFLLKCLRSEVTLNWVPPWPASGLQGVLLPPSVSSSSRSPVCLCVSGSLAGNSGRELSLLSYLSPSTRSPVSRTLQLIQEADKHR